MGRSSEVPIPSTKEARRSTFVITPAASEAVKGRGRLDLDSVGAHVRRALSEATGDARSEPTSAPGNEHDIDLGKIFQDLERDGTVARHNRLVLDRMQEQTVEALEAAFRHTPPKPFERHANVARAESLDRGELGFWRSLGHHDRAGKTELAGDPGDSLRPVSGARGEDTPVQFVQRGGRGFGEGVHGASELERPDGLQVLELEVYVPMGLGGVESHQGRPEHFAGDGLTGRFDRGQRNHKEVLSRRPPDSPGRGRGAKQARERLTNQFEFRRFRDDTRFLGSSE